MRNSFLSGWLLCGLGLGLGLRLCQLALALGRGLGLGLLHCQFRLELTPTY